MNYLMAGIQSTERVNLLLWFTRIKSPELVEALHDHLVKGHTETSAAMLNDVKLPNFNRALQRMREVAAKIEEVKELDWAHLNKD